MRTFDSNFDFGLDSLMFYEEFNVIVAVGSLLYHSIGLKNCFVEIFTRRSARVARGEATSSSMEAAQRQQVYTQGIVFTNREAKSKYKMLHERKMKTTKWACKSTLAKLGISNNFNLLCANAGLQDFVYQGHATYHRLMLEFLNTLAYNVGHSPRVDEEEWITFHLMNQDFNITLEEWCNYFGFTNNDDDVRYVYEYLEPHSRRSFNQMSYHCYKHRASCIEYPAIRYIYYVITNSLQAQGEVSNLNEENMLVLGKAANLDVGYSPNLGAILLFHHAHQSNCSQGDIMCGGVITMLANSLGLDYTNLRPIAGNTLVNIIVVSSAAMVVVRRRHYCIRIPRVEYLLPTPMPNRFSIENKILHY